MPPYDRFRSKTYCQTDEESVLLNLLDALPPVPGYAVDVGAGDGRNLSNTQIFVEAGWAACRLDSRYEDSETLHREFITRENVAALLRKYDVPRDVGLLSIDIDGNDLYVLAAHRPAVIVFEFNGCRSPASHDVIRDDPDFFIDGDYYDASWSAFAHVLSLHRYTPMHQSHSLNGCAVDAAFGLAPLAEPPPRSQYHPHRPDRVWLDARELFPGR